MRANPGGGYKSPSVMLRSLLREPLFHFVVIAVLLLELDVLFSAWRKPVIEIDAPAVAARAPERGLLPTAEERAALVRGMVEEEILFREAKRRGMVADNQVRDTLVAMMRSALKPITGDPTDEQLRTVYADMRKEDVTMPAQLSFEHVSYARADEVPAGLLAKLRAGSEPRPPGGGVSIQNPVPLNYRPQIERIFGGDFARRAFAFQPGRWEGPVTSRLGVHFIRVVAKEPERQMTQEELRPMLEAKWRKQTEDAAISREVEKLAEGYHIILPTMEETGAAK